MNTKIKNKRISALIPSFLVDEVKRSSEIEDSTQSEIIKKALEEWFNKRLAEDAKEISKMKFDDLPTEDEWLMIQSKID
jgi:hypothetical protein